MFSFSPSTSMLCQLKYHSKMSTWKPDRLFWKKHWLWIWLIVLTTALSLLFKFDIPLWRRVFYCQVKRYCHGCQKCEALCNCLQRHAKWKFYWHKYHKPRVKKDMKILVYLWRILLQMLSFLDITRGPLQQKESFPFSLWPTLNNL